MSTTKDESPPKRKKLVVVGGALVILLAAGGGWFAKKRHGSKPTASTHATASPHEAASPHESPSPHQAQAKESEGHGKPGGPDAEWMELTNLVSTDINKGEVEAAGPNAESALELARQKGDARLMVTSLHNLGKIRLSQGKTQESIRLFEQAVDYGKSVEDPDQKLAVMCLNKLAAAHYANEESAQARQALLKALEMVPEKDPFRIELLQNLSAVYIQEGNESAAAALQEQIRVLKIQEREPPACFGTSLLWSSRVWPSQRYRLPSESYVAHIFGENKSIASSRYVWRKYPPPTVPEGEATPAKEH